MTANTCPSCGGQLEHYDGGEAYEYQRDFWHCLDCEFETNSGEYDPVKRQHRFWVVDKNWVVIGRYSLRVPNAHLFLFGIHHRLKHHSELRLVSRGGI